MSERETSDLPTRKFKVDGSARDPIHVAAFVADNQDRGLVVQCDPSEVADLRDQGYMIVDVRPSGSFAAGTVEGAVNIPLASFRDRLDALPGDQPLLVHCQVGRTSYLAVRILAAQGRYDVVNLAGGYSLYARGNGLD